MEERKINRIQNVCQKKFNIHFKTNHMGAQV